MGELVFAGLCPHPPIIVPQVGKGETVKVSATVAALRQIAINMLAKEPEVVVFITPHGTVFTDAVGVVTVDPLRGNLGQFGAPEINFDLPNALDLSKAIVDIARQKGISMARIDRPLATRYQTTTDLDHGIMVPLYFLVEAGLSPKLVSISMGLLARHELYMFGVALQEAIFNSSYRVAVVASGDLSHRLTPDAPAGFNPRGEEFDRLVKGSLEKMDIQGLIDLPWDLVEQAGECGLRPLLMMLGSLEGLQVRPEILSYEGPFGVGYLVAQFIPTGRDERRMLLSKLLRQKDERIQQVRKKESFPVSLARESLENYVQRGQIIEAPLSLPPELAKKAGAFVSIKKNGQLRGCIGTISPTKDNVAQEIISNAIKAGTGDPRFDPVEPEELEQLVYSVDILHEPEPVESLDQLDPRQYGVIVKSRGRSGVLLPNLDGIDTAEEQVAIARQKAGIGPGEKVQLYRFKVDRYH